MPPSHLSTASKRWFSNVLDDFDLEESDRKLLTLAAESWDRGTLARETIAKEGLPSGIEGDFVSVAKRRPALLIPEPISDDVDLAAASLNPQTETGQT
jgi:hypothetical protein